VEVIEEVIEEVIPVEEEKGFFAKHTGLNTGTFFIIFGGILVFILLLVGARTMQ
jgi:uncharacterized integral membrane protein